MRIVAGVELIKLLGRGSMADVWLGNHLDTHETVAIKFLRTDVLDSEPTFAARFEREGRLGVQIRHPNIVRMLDYGMDGQRRYIIMEPVTGGTIANLLAWKQPISVKRVLLWAWQIAQALSSAAALRIVHRDIKPANLMLTPNRDCKLADLGLAKQFDPSAGSGAVALTLNGVGTPSYVSPEQILEARNADTRSDIYSLGVCLYEMLSGHRPFDAPNVERMLEAHLYAPVPQLHSLCPRLPTDLCDMVHRMLDKDREARHQSAAELASELAHHARLLNVELRLADMYESAVTPARLVARAC